jgi:uncharacterized repeat protein (TIGR01451 family)
MIRRKNMQRNRKLYLLVLGILSLAAIVVIAGNVSGKSLYLIANHHTAQFDAWNIFPDGSPAYQFKINLADSTSPSGIAIDESSNTLFITSEFANNRASVEMVNATTMTILGSIDANVMNLGGICVDDENDVVYAVKRYDKTVYVFDWDPVAQLLTLQPGYPKILPGCSGAFGASLDESQGILWVADAVSPGIARAYFVSSWTEDTSRSFEPVHQPVDITVDRQRGLVYTVSMTAGAWTPGGTGSNLLSKYNLSTGLETTVDMGCQGVGVAVDEVTGYVYVTVSPHCGGGATLQVWNTFTSPWTQVDTDFISGSPAGICIPQEDVVYNPPPHLSKIDNLPDDGCVPPGGYITYTICYDNSDSTYDATNVIIVDDLPSEVSYISDNGGGIYDPGTHTITWNIGIVPGGQASQCIDLIVQVLPSIPPDHIIWNYVTIDSDQTEPVTRVEDTKTCSNQCPVADADGPYVGPEGFTMAFDGTGSYDPDGDPLMYFWDLDGDGLFDDSFVPIASNLWCDDYSGTVSLKVSDRQCEDIDSSQVTIYNVAPTVDAGPDVSLLVGQAIDRVGVITDPGCDTWNIMVRWGDGTPGFAIFNSPIKTFDIYHEYMEPGDYLIIVNVRDDDGGFGSDTVWVHVECVPEVWVDDDWFCQSDVDKYDPGLTWQYDAWNSIQDAVDVVCEGGIVHVLNGMYKEVNDILLHKTDILVTGVYQPPFDVSLKTAAMVYTPMLVTAEGVCIENFAFIPPKGVASITVNIGNDVKVNHNKFMIGCRDDAIAIENKDNAVIDARFNWWGAMDGPSGDVIDPYTGRPAEGFGAIIVDNGPVHFDPWAGLDACGTINLNRRLLQFDGSCSFAYHLDGTPNTINEYLWDFGDGQYSNKKSGVHYYANPGTYLITLRIRAVDPILHHTFMYDLEVFRIVIK